MSENRHVRSATATRLSAAGHSIDAKQNQESTDDGQSHAAFRPAHHQLARQPADYKHDADHDIQDASHGRIINPASELRNRERPVPTPAAPWLAQPAKQIHKMPEFRQKAYHAHQSGSRRTNRTSDRGCDKIIDAYQLVGYGGS